MVERAPDHDEELVDFERLLKIVERAELHCFDRTLDGRVGGHHQDLRSFVLWRGRDVLANQVQAVQLRHDVVDEDDVERPFRQQALRLSR